MCEQPRGISARDWCWTSGTLPEPDKEKCRYYCWGEEIAPTTGKLHYQGFIITKRTNGWRAIQRIVNGSDGLHVESRRGTRQQARDYCLKDGTNIVEWGQFEALTSKQLFEKAGEAGGIDFLKKNYPEFYCRYYKGLERLQSKGPKWRGVPEVIWIWGKAGVGKTRHVMEQEDVYKLDSPYKWWDGYEGENILLLDDYEIEHIPRGSLVNILDGYRLRLETKGSHTWALWNKVYITSNWDPKKFMSMDEAIERRITKVIELTK